MSRHSIKSRFASARKRFEFAMLRRIGSAWLRLTKQDPIAIVMVDGGLCSVMTKYVLGECLRAQLGLNVKYDLSWFEKYGTDADGKPTRRLTLTELFPNVELEAATQSEIKFYKRFFNAPNPLPYAFNEDLLRQTSGLYVDGYAENWRYVDKVSKKILTELDFDRLQLDAQNKAMLSEIKQAEVSVAVHVRRGDYVNLGLATLSAEYYAAAIERIRGANQGKSLSVYFFSDNIEWVKSEIIPSLEKGVDATCVEINDVTRGHFDLMLISNCDHQISSNSSFGYWGGILNKNAEKTVIIPEHWMPLDRRTPEHQGCDDAHNYPGFVKMENQPT